MPKPVIYLGADHAGFDIKEQIKAHLLTQNYQVEDLGASALEPDDDYPVFAKAVAGAVVEHPGSFGLLSCGNAVGVCIVANKQRGIRAGIGYSSAAAASMRNDDDANIICLPGRLPLADDLEAIVEAFLQTPTSNEARHLRRRSQIE